MSVGARQLSVGINLCEIIGQAALMSPAPLQLQLAGPRVGLLLELQMNHRRSFHNHREGSYYGLLLVKTMPFSHLIVS